MHRHRDIKPPPLSSEVGLPMEAELYCRYRLNPELDLIDCFVKAGFTTKRTAKAKKEAQLYEERPAIQRRIEELRHMMYHRMEITAQRIEEEYAAMAFTKISDVIEWGVLSEIIGYDGDDNPITLEKPFIRPKNSDALNGAVMSAIQEISMGPNGMKVKLHDKYKALDALARRFPEFVPKSGLHLEPPNPDDIETPLTEDEIALLEEEFEGKY